MIRSITSRRIAFVRGLRLLVLASLFGIAPAASQSRHAPATQMAAANDPFARVYVVTAQQTHDQALSGLADRTTAHVDALGRRLVIADLRAHQLADSVGTCTEKEHRRGGYFAFEKRDEAERFVPQPGQCARNPGSVPAQLYHRQPGGGESLDRPVREANIRNTITHLSTAYPNVTSPNHGATRRCGSATMARLARNRSDVSVELFTHAALQHAAIGDPHHPGNELADEIVVIGGHLTRSPASSGDDHETRRRGDDASGSATLTEVLGVGDAQPYRPQRTIKFHGLRRREVGLRGSRAIAQSFEAQGATWSACADGHDQFPLAASETDIRVMTDNSNAALGAVLRDLFATYMAPSVTRWATRPAAMPVPTMPRGPNPAFPRRCTTKARFSRCCTRPTTGWRTWAATRSMRRSSRGWGSLSSVNSARTPRRRANV